MSLWIDNFLQTLSIMTSFCETYICQVNELPNGQLISKCLFGAFNFSQNTNENKSTWGIIVIKSNISFVFMGELRIPKSPFEISWPLGNPYLT